MPRQFQKTLVGGMTLEARTRMLGLFHSKVPPSRPGAAVAINVGDHLCNLACNDFALHSFSLPSDRNRRVYFLFNRFVESRNLTKRLPAHWKPRPGFLPRVCEAGFGDQGA
jgi:hypothetical protein